MNVVMGWSICSIQGMGYRSTVAKDLANRWQQVFKGLKGWLEHCTDTRNGLTFPMLRLLSSETQ